MVRFVMEKINIILLIATRRANFICIGQLIANITSLYYTKELPANHSRCFQFSPFKHVSFVGM